MSVTLKDIAQDVNVSLQTVSRILNSDKAGLYSEATQKKVRDSAEKLGYRLNTQAQGMRKGQSPCIGLLLTDTGRHNSVSSEILWSTQTRLNHFERHALLVMMPPEGHKSEGALPPVLQTQLLDGMLLNRTRALSPEVSTALAGLSMPLVTLNDNQGTNCIHPDDYVAAFDATLDFIDRGHRDIAYVDMATPIDELAYAHYSIGAREQGYADAMKDRGLSPKIWRSETTMDYGQRYRYLEDQLVANDSTSAVLAYSYGLNGEYLMKIAARLGKRVPDDISIKAFGAEPAWDWGLPIDMVMVPQADMASQGVDMLMQLIEGDRQEIPTVILPMTTRVGKTVVNGPHV